MAERLDSNMTVATAARAAGLRIDIRTMARSTRTAQDAADACGCGVAQIVKSLIFKGKNTGHPVLLLVSGQNRVDEQSVARHVGEALERPDAAFVRAATGYAIGGIPPIGHRQAIATYMDADLLAHDMVYAAAGTPHSIFSVSPDALRVATGARVIAMHEG